jgi:transposase
MSYIIEQPIKGRIYLYKVDSYWDKDKQQSRQKRTYIGPKDQEKKINIKSIKSNIVYKNYGNIFLLNWIVEKTGLLDICSNCFPQHYKELLAMAYYQIVESSPLYLFPFWLEENYLPGVRNLDSPAISRFCEEIGRAQGQKLEFQEQWISHLQPVEALYYDITSISSYSTNIEFVEWGYNRDKEDLPQVNIGVVFCNKRSLPIYYSINPGSIVDVKTLTNCIKFLQSLGLKEFMFILDRGFFSTGNITQISQSQHKINFIQPLPLSLKKVKDLIKTHKRGLHDIKANFAINGEVLSHVKTKIQLDDMTYPTHVFLNEKAELDQRQTFMKKLFDIEDKVIRNKTFSSQKQALAFKEGNIEKTYQDCFRFNRSTGRLSRDNTYVKAKISKLGYFMLMTNTDKLDRLAILSNYRDRDQVEKVFDLLKNEMDAGRLRAHNQFNTDARMFINFLALIIQSELIARMRKADLFKKYTVRELIAELRKIKHSNINGQIIISEISKKQRLIFEGLEIDMEKFHRY